MDIKLRIIQLTGISYILLLAVLIFIMPSGAPKLPDGYITPIIAFEFARTPEDIRAVFDIVPGEARQAYIEKMNRGNRLDFDFMVVYSLFLFFFSLKCHEVSRKKVLLAGALLSITALGGDIAENIQLLGITENLDTGDLSGYLHLLHIFTWIKWMSISLVFAVLSLYFYRRGTFGNIISFFGLLAAATALAAFFDGPVLKEALALVVGLDFILLTVYSFVYRKELMTGEAGAAA